MTDPDYIPHHTPFWDAFLCGFGIHRHIQHKETKISTKDRCRWGVKCERHIGRYKFYDWVCLECGHVGNYVGSVI